MRDAARGVRGLPGGAKKKWQPDADIAGAFGASALDAGDAGYERTLGLWLNCQRAETRRAIGVLTGIRAALGQDVPREFLAAIADEPDEAAAMAESWAAEMKAAEDRERRRAADAVELGAM